MSGGTRAKSGAFPAFPRILAVGRTAASFAKEKKKKKNPQKGGEGASIT